MRLKFLLYTLALFSLVGGVVPAFADSDFSSDIQTTVHACVLDVIQIDAEEASGYPQDTQHQQLRVEILSGDQRGKEVVVDNDYVPFAIGEEIYLKHTLSGVDGSEYYTVSDPYRLPQVLFIVGLFIAAVCIFGGWQGVRGLLSLAISLLLIFGVLFPAILHGYSPLIASILVALFIVIAGSYITHKVNKTTSAAVVGMMIAVIFTGFLAYYAVHIAKLFGLGSDAAVYLNLNTAGSIDFVGLLLGGILIGLLGVLYDAAISQAIAVEELHHAGPHLSRRFIFSRALRMGREHIGALVNTLAIAYVGVSLPVLLFFYSSTATLGFIINAEFFATEIVRAMIGGIGVVLAVPITTLVSVMLLVPRAGAAGSASVAKATLEHERAAAEQLVV